jgi:subtilisin family serine protease
VYRARTLLVPGDVIKNQPDVIKAVNIVLAGVGMRLVTPPAPPDHGELRRASRKIADTLLALPRVAVLKPARLDGEPVRPQVVDAWVALQALRAAAVPKSRSWTGWQSRGKLDQATVERFSLEHMLISSGITGNGAHGHGGGLTGLPDESSGVTGPSSIDSYVYRGGDTRAPVAVSLRAPHREPDEKCEHDYGRRPVVAVLDTGLRAHPWLGVEPNGDDYKFTPDASVAIDPSVQAAIRSEGEAAHAGDESRQVIRNAWDRPITADKLVGELDTDTGHGTFIAGIVRQVAPNAQVLAVRVMHSDGIVYEGDLILALRLLAERVTTAEPGDLAGMIDVVSLSLGYFDESAADEVFSSGLWQVIETLLGLGVVVVAAAGNYSTSREFYPAAFIEEPEPTPVPLFSVGALNPNRSRTVFSDGGQWINAWASGAAVVSTFPVDVNGSRSPEIKLRGRRVGEREALDPDDYSGGFAVWSGTSFSAPLLAAHIARALAVGAANRARRLGRPGQAAAIKRAVAALTDLGWRE